MADNVTSPVPANTKLATDEIAGVHYPRSKVSFGPDGSATDVSRATPLPVLESGAEYETVAASQTNQLLGSSGATGDVLLGLLVIPTTTTPGAISIKDSTGGSDITLFAGGTVGGLIPFGIPLGIKSTAGPWYVTTGANVSVIAIGDFS